MQAIDNTVRLDRNQRFTPVAYRYTCAGIGITPNPPQVGVPTIISLRLKNSSTEPLTVSRIEVKIAQFGMGVAWEELPVIGPLHLPSDPEHIEEVKIQWTPLTGGHRCVRATIYIETISLPIHAGCNLHVIESEAERAHWTIPFRLGNPEKERMPIVLSISGNDPTVDARVIIAGRMQQAGDPIWLNPHEEVDALLLLRARTNAALASVTSVEALLLQYPQDGSKKEGQSTVSPATSPHGIVYQQNSNKLIASTPGGRFLDGIQVVVHRPARITQRTRHFVRARDEAITEEVPVPILQANKTKDTFMRS